MGDCNMDEVRKCGEIFIDEDDLFSFICTFCESPFQEVNNFFLHIKEDHEQKYNINKQRKIKIVESNNDTFEKQDEKSIHIPETEIKVNPKNKSNSIELNASSKILDNNTKRKYEFENESTTVWNHNMKKDSNKSVDSQIDEVVSERTEDKLECLVCGKCFSNVDRFRIHNEKKICVDKSIKPSFKCGRCGKEFKTQRYYRRHKDLSKCQSTNGISDSNIETISRDNHMQETHERTYIPKKSFQCHICGKQFRTKLLCENHENLHTGKKSFKCDICNLEFRSPGNLHSHKQRHGERKFSCRFCERTFFRRFELLSHERIHTGDKPYKCRFCGKCFKTSSSMTYHQKTHLQGSTV